MCIITYNANNIQCMIEYQGIQTLVEIFNGSTAPINMMAGMDVAMLCKDTPKIRNIVRSLLNYLTLCCFSYMK